MCFCICACCCAHIVGAYFWSKASAAFQLFWLASFWRRFMLAAVAVVVLRNFILWLPSELELLCCCCCCYCSLCQLCFAPFFGGCANAKHVATHKWVATKWCLLLMLLCLLLLLVVLFYDIFSPFLFGYLCSTYVCLHVCVCVQHGCWYANIVNMWPRVMQQLAQQHVFASFHFC